MRSLKVRGKERFAYAPLNLSQDGSLHGVIELHLHNVHTMRAFNKIVKHRYLVSAKTLGLNLINLSHFPRVDLTIIIALKYVLDFTPPVNEYLNVIHVRCNLNLFYQYSASLTGKI